LFREQGSRGFFCAGENVALARSEQAARTRFSPRILPSIFPPLRRLPGGGGGKFSGGEKENSGQGKNAHFWGEKFFGG